MRSAARTDTQQEGLKADMMLLQWADARTRVTRGGLLHGVHVGGVKRVRHMHLRATLTAS